MSRVFLTSDGTTKGTRITDAQGQQLAVEAVNLTIRGPRPIGRLQVDLHQWTAQAEAEGEFYVTHPLTGERKRVARIQFADGTDWSA